jgi:hypothetical protein
MRLAKKQQPREQPHPRQPNQQPNQKQRRQRRRATKKISLKLFCVPLKKEFALALLLCSFVYCHAQNKKVEASNRNIQALAEMQETAQTYWLNSSIRTTDHNGLVSAMTLVNYDLKVSRTDSTITAKSFDSTIFNFDKEGRQTAFAYYPGGVLNLAKKMDYDNTGKLSSTKEDSYGGKYHGIYNYEYNAAGKIIHETWQLTSKKSYNRNDYIYDKAGWLIRKVSVTGDNDTNYVFNISNTSKGEKKSFERYLFRKKTKSVRYEYDRQGRISEVRDTVFLNNSSDAEDREFADTLVRHRRLKYDRKDNLVSEDEFGWYIVWQRKEITTPRPRPSNDTVAKQEATNSEDVMAPLKRYEFYKSSGDASDTVYIKYDYDKQGNLTELQMDRNNQKTVSEFRYEYDSKNNWIAIRYFRNGQPAREIKRRIEYYE